MTLRQQEVLTLLAEGLPNADIAGRLGISVYVAERHRESIMQRPNPHARTDVVKYTLRMGLMQLGVN